MATYTHTKKSYYTLAYGKLKHFEKDGGTSEYDGIDGIFTGVTERTREVNGEKKVFIDINFRDGNEDFCISCEKYNNNGNTILRCLKNANLSVKVLIETWQTEKNGRSYTNISVKQEGKRVPWIDIPEIETFDLPTGERAKSPKKRNAFIDNLIAELNAAVNGGVASHPAPTVVDPEPEEDVPGPGAASYGGYIPAEENYPTYIPNEGM